jgi:hypothetical protein
MDGELPAEGSILLCSQYGTYVGRFCALQYFPPTDHYCTRGKGLIVSECGNESARNIHRRYADLSFGSRTTLFCGLGSSAQISHADSTVIDWSGQESW